jgi:hypothetical protein
MDGFQILGVQVIGIVLAILIFYEARVLYQRGKFKRRDFGIWSTLSIAFLIVSIVPSWVQLVLGKATSLARGLDAFIIVAIFGAYALIFQVYIRIQETNRQVTELVRKVALELEKSKKSKK